jgi:hypothetical protein
MPQSDSQGIEIVLTPLSYFNREVTANYGFLGLFAPSPASGVKKKD